jgi:hypothetical protein
MVLALGAVLALPSGASAAFAPLNERRALPIATKLARQTALKREVRSWQLSPAVKVRSNRVVFIYSDRRSNEVFCTAKLVVEQSALRRRAFIAAPRCNGIPTEALEIESATGALIRAAQGQRDELRLSIRRIAKDERRCEGLVVPRSRHNVVEDMTELGEILASFDPLLPHLDAFATRLQEIQPEDPLLASGVVRWRRFVSLMQRLPRELMRPCTLVLKWSETNYSEDTAPVDPELVVDAELSHYLSLERGLMRTAEHMLELGLSPRIAPSFVPVELFDRTYDGD